MNRRDLEALSARLAYEGEATVKRIEFKSLRGARTLGHKAAARVIRNKRKLEAAKRIPFSGYFPPGAPILPRRQPERMTAPVCTYPAAAIAAVMAFYDAAVQEANHA